MRDYASYFIDRKMPEKRGVSVRHNIDWWMGDLANRMAKLLFIVLLALLFLTLKSFWQLSKSQSTFPITQVSLNDAVLLTRPDDIQTIFSKFEDSTFFTVDIDALSDELSALPWVSSATVTRFWPNGLSVSLIERQAAYRWGENELLDADGVRFPNRNPTMFTRLPQLSGVTGHESEVIYAYQQLISALGPRVEALGIADFTLNQYLSWELHLTSGVVIKFGRDNYQQRLGRFVQAYRLGKLPDINTISSIDLRYNHGFAVKWKPEFAPQKEQEQLVKVTQTKI
ncbi:MAG: hypothetical protein CSA45_02070 [Gammaproteobacteria bacterium]|nr:MAG: hypothetical protein CSA45_02070 [Gammaproteobacteria bacterium]